MSHEPATPWRKEPTFETTDASHKALN